MKKSIRKLALVLSIVLMGTLFVACGNKDKVTINFFNYAANIPDEVLKDFEKQTGIKVNMDTYSEPEEMYAKLSSGASKYDVILSADYMVQRLVQEERIQKIDFSEIPNFENIHEDHLGKLADPKNEYSIPYMSGTIGILYNTDLVKEPVESWKILWDEKYANNVIMMDAMRDSIGVALKSLGYSVNTTDPKELKEAEDVLKKLKETNIKAWMTDEMLDAMVAGEAAFAVIWSGEGLNLEAEHDNLKYVVPKEGANFWIDSLVIPNGAEHKEEAEIFMNFLCEKEPAFDIADEIGYTTPNKLAREAQEDNIKNNPNAYMPKELVDKCEAYAYLGDNLKLYEEVYNKVKID
ncbi:MAG: ABC transporter substrate-binding protein [Clostridium sp.]